MSKQQKGTGMKKQSLLEKALSLGFTMADPNAPIYSSGV